MGMIGNISGAVTNAVNGGQTAFMSMCGPNGASSQSATESQVNCVMPCAGSFSYLFTRLVLAPQIGNSRTFTARKNAADQTLTCVVADTNITASDTTNSFSVSAGDLVAMKEVASASVNATAGTFWAMKFTANNTKEYPLLWSSNIQVPAATTRYAPLQGGIAPNATELTIQQVMPCGGTLSKMYVVQDAAVVTTSNNITLRVDTGSGAADTALTVNIAVAGTTGNDTTHSVSVNAGDVVSVRTDNNSVIGSRFTIGILFSPTNDGDCPLLCSNGTTSQNSTVFTSPNGSAASGTETTKTSIVIAGTVKQFYGRASGPIANGQTITVTNRKNSAAGNQSTVFTGDGTNIIAGNDTTHISDSYSDGDRLDYRLVSSVTAGAGLALMAGLVFNITQPATGGNTSSFFELF